MIGAQRMLPALPAWCLVCLVAMTGLGSPEAGLQAYRAHKFDDAIAACKGGSDFMSRLVLGLSYAERYGVYRNKQDKVDKTMYLKILAMDARIGDAMTIERFLNLDGNPCGNKEAAKLLKKAFDVVRTPEDVLLVSKFLAPDKGVDVNKMALKAIRKWLKPIRGYVDKGGSMPEPARAVFSDGNLIKRLIGALAHTKTDGDAESCLTLIEEPSLLYLDARADLGKAEGDAIVSIKKAIAKRLKKRPESTWFSAYGK